VRYNDRVVSGQNQRVSAKAVRHKRPTKDEVVSAFRRDQILSAAHAVFASRGYREATVGDIADAAGIAKGTLYLYFKSKDSIYWAALHRGLDQLHALTRSAMERAVDPHAKLLAFVDTKVRFFDEDREFFSIYFAEFGNVVPQHVPAQKAFLRRYLAQAAMLDDAFGAAAAAGLVRRSPVNGLGFSVLAITHSVISRRLRGWSDNTLEEDVRLAVDLLWNGLAEPAHV
jgi:AcrR family transcriptional regulator